MADEPVQGWANVGFHRLVGRCLAADEYDGVGSRQICGCYSALAALVTWIFGAAVALAQEMWSAVVLERRDRRRRNRHDE
jgi:hypothetical protein